MKNIFKRTEFWIATTLLGLGVYHLSDRFYYNWLYGRFDDSMISISSFVLQLLPLYFGFLFLNFYVIPHYYDKGDYKKAIRLMLFCMLGVLVFFLTYDISRKINYINKNGFDDINMRISLILSSNIWYVFIFSGVFILYLIIRKTIESFWRDPLKKKKLFSKVLRDFLVAVGIITGLFLLFIQDNKNQDEAAFVATILPYAFIFFMLNVYWLYPKAEKKNWDTFTLGMQMIFFSLLICSPFSMTFMQMIMQTEFSLFIFIWICSLIVIIPSSRYIYFRNREHFLEVSTLKNELTATTSNLQFLRSQINPHFLFNALNTLYGTALQEKSERTAQGIQKLGDMMRFMLHENNQDKILIEREIDYIRNYIELQLLRTQLSPDITVETEIPDLFDNKHIAPMLLIPFIENAFKHGISLTHKSWIRINLHTERDKLYFDVYNSVHQHSGTDPEKDKSGIGLDNVKQRLELIYPNRHELLIRETPQEFFVHLTVNL